MQYTLEKPPQRAVIVAGVVGLVLATLLSLCVAHVNNSQLLGHSAYDSYTRQAMAWREGRIALPENVVHLELAIYEGEYYVSFPPVPTIPMWLLTFIFGANTPDALVTYLYFLLCYVAGYALALRFMRPGMAAGLSLFALLAGSLLDLGVSAGGAAGAVWYEAQTLGALLTYLAFLGVTGGKPRDWAWGLIAIALAVGCRPFQALYVVPLLLLVLGKVRAQTPDWRSILKRMAALCTVPALIAVAYGVYNFVRFGNPLEFGHNYLPEYTFQGGTQFSLGHVLQNIQNVLRPPTWSADKGLVFPTASGFAYYITNPLLVIGPAALLISRRRKEPFDWVVLGCALTHIFLLLLQRSFGSWQYGTRFFCDVMPAMFLLRARAGERLVPAECAVMGALTLFNVYGTMLFHIM